MKKTILVLFFLITIFSLNACGGGNDTSNSPYPENIPEILKITVGTLGNISFTSGISDNPDYNSVLTMVYENTTEEDYSTLMEHYQSASTGADENNALLFEWGRLLVSSDNGSITINAFIK